MSDNLQAKLIDENTFTNTLIKLFDLKVPNTPLQPKNPMITKAIQYINDNCAEKFDLERLAEEVYLSKYYLVRLFRREMGITPHQYYQQCKVRELRKMALCFSQKNIAYELNFSTQSHMDSVFKKYMGITMKNYIKNAVILSGIATFDIVNMQMTNTLGYPIEYDVHNLTEPLELASLDGTIINSKPHIHGMIGNGTHTWAGHMLNGCRILYLGEVVIQEVPGSDLIRKPDKNNVYLIHAK